MRELWTFNNVQGYYSTDMGYYDGRNIIPMSSFTFLEFLSQILQLDFTNFADCSLHHKNSFLCYLR